MLSLFYPWLTIEKFLWYTFFVGIISAINRNILKKSGNNKSAVLFFGDDKDMKEHFNKKEVLEKIIPVIENTAMRYNLIPLEVSFEKENGHWFLRIFIYCMEHSVNHQDCENISRSLGDMLDELIPFKYYLEVSSPGLDKKLKTPLEFQIFKGHSVNVKLKNQIDEELEKTFKGKLIDYNDSFGLKIFAYDTQKEYEIDPENIFTIRLNDIEEL